MREVIGIVLLGGGMLLLMYVAARRFTARQQKLG